ncbi:MAG TPA: MltA domain-containing protein [Rhabdaerophilum sp.]|nr:MltA domain-containing protein [Rhabdaerophilum sp.]
MNPPSDMALPPGTRAVPFRFDALPGWSGDDHAAAFTAFFETCRPLVENSAALRAALPPPPALVETCRRALALDAGLTAVAARAFFEVHFAPYEIIPEGGNGFLTAYFEPVIEASLKPSTDFPVPVLGRPSDLVTLRSGEAIAPPYESLQAARRTASGLEPFATRAAIWAGALDGQGLEIAWLRDHAELFIVQVQGSARLRLPDGRTTRLVYAGRNGHPYTSIGRKLVESGEIPLGEMSLARLMGWLRANPAGGRVLMEENFSYVFFARDDSAPPDRGPIGGAGVPLTTGRSLAVDRAIWPYGVPVHISVETLAPEGGRRKIERLMIAQDTGSAIVGPARGDYFMGTGPEAGDRAGLVRDACRFIVLWPKG